MMQKFNYSWAFYFIFSIFIYNTFEKEKLNMRNTQSILYKIGKIINFVLLGIYGLTFLLNLIFLIVDAVNDRIWADNLGTMISMLILAALVIVLIILCGKFEEDAKKAPVDALTPVILLMVFGLVSGNWLYLVGGVFGIIAASQEKNAQSEQPKEEAKEEPKEENK